MKIKTSLLCYFVGFLLAIGGCNSATESTPEVSNVPEIQSMEIPESIRAEHAAIHETLLAATQLPGKTGEAARELAEVLHPHFVREEEIALPPLGLLEQLAQGAEISDTVEKEVLKMTDALKAELPKMLEEHKAIRAEVEALLKTARAEDQTSAVEVAEELAAHAKNEEQVLYPTAILVGEIVRARAKG